MNILAVSAFLLLSLGCTVRAGYAESAASAVDVLNEKFYFNHTGLWYDNHFLPGCPKGDPCRELFWWESANFIETIARLGQVLPSFKPKAAEIILNSYVNARNVDDAELFKNDYCDDEGWWAMAFIASYDLTGNEAYLDQAQSLYDDMRRTGGYACNGGGIFWGPWKHEVNAITNELFFSVGAHLINRVSDDFHKADYTFIVQKQWDWFKAIGFINSENLIVDGLRECKNMGGPMFTYSHGVILAALSEFSRAKNGTDAELLKQARATADAVLLSNFTKDGILTESREGMLDVQAALFKGPFVRGLSTLNQQIKNQTYTDFLKKNADSLLEQKKRDGLFPDGWQGSEFGNAGSQGAGIDLLVAAAQAEHYM